MLDCRSDRLDYGKLLRPPVGYVLDRAVATTYSADLQTLLSIPVALVYAQTLEGDLGEVRFQLLEAVKKFSDKVVVYHQAGCLHVPAVTNWLYAFLEDALAPILPDDAFTAFHPKTWLIRYTERDGSGPPVFRLIVLSRNLTFDRSWDVAACFDGIPGSEPLAKNQPLVDFHRWLHKQRPMKRAQDLFDELERVSFDCPGAFEEIEFHPIGIPGHRRNPVREQKAKRALVMSPFLHAKTLAAVRANVTHRLHVLSERSALQAIPLAVREAFQSYALSELIIDGESCELAEDGDADVQRQHLHAKLFVFRTAVGGVHWFLGSANATEAACERNVEFMVELRGSHWASRPHYLLKDLVDEDGSGPFVELPPDLEEPDGEATRQRNTLRRFEHALLSADIDAWIEHGSSRGTYDLHLDITAPAFPDFEGFKVTVAPFNIDTTPQELGSKATSGLRFSGISEVHLSRFLRFQIEASDLPTKRFLLCIPIRGLPKQRLEQIFRRMIDSSDKFFQYLQFLLVDEVAKEDLLVVTGADRTGQADTTENWLFHAPLYEQLLVAASRSPSKLRAVDEVIMNLQLENSDVIPEEFLAFWEAFRPLLPVTEPVAKA